MVSEKVKEEGSCGKSCEACPHRQANDCPGCTRGPGQKGVGECELARCRREHGYPPCSACRFRVSCGTYRRWHDAAQDRLDERRAEIDRRLELSRTDPDLSLLLWILFWLTLLGTFSIRLTTSGGDAAQQELFWSIAGLVRTAVCGVLFLRLSKEENTYRTAGLFTLVSVALSLLTLFLPADAMGGGLILVLGLCGTGLSIAAEYYECSAHAALAERWDEQLAGKWRMLWKWRAAALIAAAAAMLLSAVPTLSLLLVLFVIAAMAVTGIWKLVCLYRTAKLFGSNG